MKKIFLTIMLFLAVNGSSAYALEYDMAYDTAVTTYTISGASEKRIPVTLRVLYVGEDKYNLPLNIEDLPEETDEYDTYLKHIDLTKADKNGNFVFSLKMDSLSGYYYFSVTDKNGEQKNTLLEWLSPTYKQEKLELFNRCIEEQDKDGIISFLKRYSEAFGLNNEYFDDLIENNADTLAELIINGKAVDTPEKLKENTVVCTVLGVFKEKNIYKTSDVLNYYAGELGLDKSEIFNTSLKNGVSEEVRGKILNDIQNIEYCTIKELKDEIIKLIVLKGIEYSSDWGVVQNILESGEELLSQAAKNAYLDLKSNNPSYYADVAKALKGEKISTLEELSTRVFDESLAANAKAQKTSSSGSRSGNSGSSKGNASSVIISGTSEVKSEKDRKSTFEDLENVQWAKDAILALAERGILSGRDEKHFDPNSFVKREEFISIIIRAFNLMSYNAECNFIDADKNAWYYSAVAAGVANRITSGISENEFGIGKDITREDLCVLALNAAAAAGKELQISTDIDFSDYEQISDYAKDAVMKLTKGQIISGTEEGIFSPKSYATRAQTALIVYKLLDYQMGDE